MLVIWWLREVSHFHPSFWGYALLVSRKEVNHLKFIQPRVYWIPTPLFMVHNLFHSNLQISILNSCLLAIWILDRCIYSCTFFFESKSTTKNLNYVYNFVHMYTLRLNSVWNTGYKYSIACLLYTSCYRKCHPTALTPSVKSSRITLWW